MDPLAAFPRSLRERSTLLRLGPAPALLVLPAGEDRVPALLWMHGRTAAKELDSARYLRLIRAGIAVVALDLPAHGERKDAARQAAEALPELLAEALGEVDPVLAALRAAPAAARIDPARLAVGGISLGGMVTLRRLCDPHPFVCAAVEATAGDFGAAAAAGSRWEAAAARGLEPRAHLAGWRPLPLLALHSERDELVPVAAMRAFVDALRGQYRARGADPELVSLRTWPETGAPLEHLGFGRVAREARELHVGFLSRWLEARARE